MAGGNQGVPKDQNRTGVANETVYTGDGTVTEPGTCGNMQGYSYADPRAMRDWSFIQPDQAEKWGVNRDETLTWKRDPGFELWKNRVYHDPIQDVKNVGGSVVLDEDGEPVRRNPDEVLMKYPLSARERYDKQEAARNAAYIEPMEDDGGSGVETLDNERVIRPRSRAEVNRRSEMMRQQGIIGPTRGLPINPTRERTKEMIEREEASYRNPGRSRELSNEEFTSIMAPKAPQGGRGGMFTFPESGLGKSTQEIVRSRTARAGK